MNIENQSLIASASSPVKKVRMRVIDYIIVYKPCSFNFDSLRVLKAYREAGLNKEEEYCRMEFYDYLSKLTLPEKASIMSERRAISQLNQLVRISRKKYEIKNTGETLVYLSDIIFLKKSNLYIFRVHKHTSETNAHYGTYIYKYIDLKWIEIAVIDGWLS